MQLPVLVVASVIGVWLFSVQHRFEHTRWVRHSEWRFSDAAFQGSSHLRLPRILQWFTGNIGFHHIHHLNPRILLPLGSKVVIDVLRKGRATQAIARLAEAMPEELEVPGSIPALSGVTLGTIEPGSRLYGHAEGAVVLAVKGDSRAAGAGLRPGDVIVSVNQKPVMSPREVVDAAGEVKGTLLLQVIRDGSGLFIAVG